MDDLSQVQLAELKKAFSIFDKDGSGSIDKAELKELMTSITDEVPSEDELSKIMLVVDKDRDGKIEWPEFASAMSSWLSEFNKAKTSNKRKSESTDQERQEVHKKIKSFFEQFKPDAQNLSKIRKQIESGTHHSSSSDYEHDIIDSEGYLVDRLTSEDKLKFLYEYRATLNNIASVVAALNDPFKQLEAISCISKLLSIVEVFKTPIERRALADDIVKTYEIIIRSGLIPIILQLTNHANSPHIQFEALRAVSFLAPGPRIASTPEDSLLHPNQMFFKKLLIAENAVPILINITRSAPVREVREQAIVALGCIASHNPEARDYLLQQGLLPALLSQLTTDTPLVMLRKLSWAISICVGVTHPVQRLPPWDQVRPALNALGSLLFANDEEVVTSVCNALSLVLPGIPEMIIDRRLVDLLKVELSPRIQIAALRTINTILLYDNVQTQMLLNNCSLLSQFSSLLKSNDSSSKLEACETLLILVGIKGEIQPVINSNIVPLLASLLSYDDSIRDKVSKIIKYMSRGTTHQIRYLVDQGIISTVCKSLSFFKSYDKVLTRVYKYVGAVYNFEFARDILVCLDNILNMGELDTDGKSLNKYAFAFDSECVDKLGSLMAAIADNPHKDEVNAWRLDRPGDTSLEEKIKDLLLKILHVHRASKDGISHHVAEMINEIITKYFTDNQATSSTVIIKTTLGNDTRAISVPKNIPFSDLKKGLELKFGQAGIILTYEDSDGDIITLDGNSSLSKAIQSFGSKPVKIRILTAKQSASPDQKEVHPAFDSPSLQRLKKRPVLERENSLDVHASKMAKTLFPEKPEVPSNITFNLDEIKKKETKQAFDNLAVSTHFGPKELEVLYNKWKSQSKNGEVTKQEFQNGLKELGIRDPLVLEQYFSAFDSDKDGKINFLEFVTGLSVVQRGDVSERLKFMFKAYDTDGNGELSPQEVYNMLQSTSRSRGQTISHEKLLQMVANCFEKVDVNHDGVINFEEFSDAVNSKQLIIDSFVNLPY